MTTMRRRCFRTQKGTLKAGIRTDPGLTHTTLQVCHSCQDRALTMAMSSSTGTKIVSMTTQANSFLTPTVI